MTQEKVLVSLKEIPGNSSNARLLPSFALEKEKASWLQRQWPTTR
jgi:hypothetical protein